jgi:mono-ADP-ribosyltransferase sirtuin 6
MKLGVWTLEKEGKKPDVNVSFEDSRPSFSHYALVYLNRISKLEFLISQNIDGLHMKSGFPLSIHSIQNKFFNLKKNNSI